MWKPFASVAKGKIAVVFIFSPVFSHSFSVCPVWHFNPLGSIWMVIFVIKRLYRILVKSFSLTLDSLSLNASPAVPTCVTLSKMLHLSEARRLYLYHWKWKSVDGRARWVHALRTVLGTFFSLNRCQLSLFFYLLLRALWMVPLCLVPSVWGRHNNTAVAEITESNVYWALWMSHALY